MKRDGRISLNTRSMMVQLGSLCLALAIFLAGMTLGSRFLQRRYLNPEAADLRERTYVAELREFVTLHGLRSTDTAVLEGWAREKKYVYLAVYQGDAPIFETNSSQQPREDSAQDGPRDSDAALPQEEGLPLPDSDGYYRLQFSDGVFRVSVVEFSETPYYDLVVIGSLALACLVLLLVNLAHNHHVTRAIIRLSHEVQWVEQGVGDAIIQSSRQDEIGDLARAVERMRRSIIQRMQSEQEAWTANSELITAISHDVRTPLTALLGYLDLLEGGQYRDGQQMSRYLTASRDKARQLKELTDELFRYFLVYASPEVKMDRQQYDAPILMEQLLGERVIRLEEKGFAVQQTPLQQPCRVELDVQYLQRVLDNLFSNVEKHADRTRPVHLLVRVEGSQLICRLANSVPARPNPAESTRIGLQTCRKILHEMGGRFDTTREEDRFLAEIALPLVPET